ncbi:uncharacterized protein LOC117628874 [Prunus dulcis]|uniref:uncharacterized protein LOC117628874 n=1 Tax=Prunus dulcis TaxID=3755 RepID=UPI0014823F68|nr:uncharacterized protein LOC117628874 [Prunus dulcis]
MNSVGSSSDGNTSNNNGEHGDNDNTPLWKYVKKLEKDGKAGGNTSFQCNYCQKTFKGSYFRVKSHLLKLKGNGVASCTKVTNSHLMEMEKVVEEAELRVKMAQLRDVPLPTSNTSSQGGSSSGLGMSSNWCSDSKKRKGNPIEKAFNNNLREQLDGEIARMFYTGGLSFQFSRNPHYVNAFRIACSKTLPGYQPPGYNMLRTTLLRKEKNNIEECLQPMKRAWQSKGVSVCSDGWSDAQRRPLINVMAVCESGPMFLKAINCEGECKDKFFMANLLIESIREIGPQNVVQVVTDNAPVCKAAGHIVEAKFKHIFWTPCVVHTLNLALKNICSPVPRNPEVYEQCSWISTISSDAWFIKNFIMNHNMRLSMYNDHCKLKLLSVAETRFASTIVMLRRFKQVKQGLEQMVISEQWDIYKEDDVVKARTVKEKILDECFWEDIDYILNFTSPIYEMLRLSDTDMPCLHLIYEWWDSMIEKVKTIIYRKERKQLNEESMFFNVVHEILVDRWTKSSTPLHCFAHSLNPKYYCKEWLDMAPNRCPPHKDIEITRERKKCIERFFSNEVERRAVNEEYASFSACIEDFSGMDSMKDRGFMAPVKWWVIHGASTPKLQTIALKLLGHPSSSSCCERNWSTYNFIHSIKRNKITPERAEDLVFVHSNLRLLSRKRPEYKEGETHMWDVGGDAFDSMDLENAGVLEIANLSLDEPDLEGIIFTHDE